MLCDRRDRRCILESGSLYNTGNHPERLPPNRMSVSSAAASPHDEECDCPGPIRTKPPPLPTALPFPATDANRAAVQNWILDKYRSSTFNICEWVPPGTKKTITDAWNGYHSVPSREDRHLTTFSTPWGRYRYKTCPQGYAASQDGYTRRFDEIVSDFPNKTKCIDDTCLWADTLEESIFQKCRWRDFCGRHGIVQDPEKFVFGSDAGEFAGFVIPPTNIQPSHKHIPATRDFSTPQNTEQVHRGCRDFRLQTFHKSRHRLVQERHRFLALAKVLHL